MLTKLSLVGKAASLSVVAGLALSGCAVSDSSTYSRSDVGQVIETGYGTVLSSRPVTIRDTGSGAIGSAGGAAAGGVVGSTIGRGTGNTLATVAGVLIGAGIGYLVEQEFRSNQGVEYIVELEDGRAVAIAQNLSRGDAPIPDGTPVLIQYGNDYTRLVPSPAGPPAGYPGSGGGSRRGSDEWINPDLNPGYDPDAPYDPDLATSSDSGVIVQ